MGSISPQYPGKAPNYACRRLNLPGARDERIEELTVAGLPAYRQVAGGSALQCELSLAPGIQSRFEAFHRANPHVYRHLVWLARQHLRAGVKRLSIDYLYHVVRWRMFLKTRGRELFKLNDHFTSRYARLIEEREPDLRGLFHNRHLRSN